MKAPFKLPARLSVNNILLDANGYVLAALYERGVQAQEYIINALNMHETSQEHVDLLQQAFQDAGTKLRDANTDLCLANDTITRQAKLQTLLGQCSVSDPAGASVTIFFSSHHLATLFATLFGDGP